MENSDSYSYTVCQNGAVNVLNSAHEPPHVYTVQLDNGMPRTCSCPDHQYRGRQCKHMKAVASHSFIRSVADAAQRATRDSHGGA